MATRYLGATQAAENKISVPCVKIIPRASRVIQESSVYQPRLTFFTVLSHRGVGSATFGYWC